MKILSIDVGIKNLAYCLMERGVTICKWDVLDLTADLKKQCDITDKNGKCTSCAKFMKNGIYYCLKHSKKEKYMAPTSKLKQTQLNKLNIEELNELIKKHDIVCSDSTKKRDIIKEINDYFINNCFEIVEHKSASDIDLVILGKKLKLMFDDAFNDCSDIDRIIIENQISPIANRMKTLQGMIAQYFIMKNMNIEIEFVSASNKLKGEDIVEQTESKELSYNQRKKLSVSRCQDIIQKNYVDWYQFFVNNKKKDDLADAFMQGRWYLRNIRTRSGSL